MSAGALSPESRRLALGRLPAERFDLLVVGGGITGLGAALDAASRGLTVALVERRDFAAGTSSRSSKLIHGGLRYLEMLDFGLVREALTERRLLLTRLAPHLVSPVRFLFPLHHRVWQRLYLGAGLALYDGMGGARHLPRARHLSRRAALAAAPALRPEGVVGAVRFHDAGEDDALFAVYVARTAAAHGALLATGVEVTGFVGDEGGRVAGVTASIDGGPEITVRARHTLVAAGPATDRVLALADPDHRPIVRPSKGVHVLVPRSAIPMRDGLFMRTERSIFHAIAWGTGHWLLGDTDTEWDASLGETPVAGREDVAYVLGKVNAAIRQPVTPDRICGVFAGLRPLVTSGGGVDTTRLSRAHRVLAVRPGLTAIAGGKYTTYRLMARDAVDAAAADLGGQIAASRTDRIPLVGGRRATGGEAPPPAAARHGSCAGEVLELAAADPALARPLAGAPGYLAAEVVHACTHQGARTLDDVLARRLRVAIEVPDRGRAAAVAAVPLVAAALSWPDDRAAAELAAYLRLRNAEQAAESAADDASAVAAYRAVLAGG